MALFENSACVKSVFYGAVFGEVVSGEADVGKAGSSKFVFGHYFLIGHRHTGKIASISWHEEKKATAWYLSRKKTIAFFFFCMLFSFARSIVHRGIAARS